MIQSFSKIFLIVCCIIAAFLGFLLADFLCASFSINIFGGQHYKSNAVLDTPHAITTIENRAPLPETDSAHHKRLVVHSTASAVPTVITAPSDSTANVPVGSPNWYYYEIVGTDTVRLSVQKASGLLNYLQIMKPAPIIPISKAPEKTVLQEIPSLLKSYRGFGNLKYRLSFNKDVFTPYFDVNAGMNLYLFSGASLNGGLRLDKNQSTYGFHILMGVEIDL